MKQTVRYSLSVFVTAVFILNLNCSNDTVGVNYNVPISSHGVDWIYQTIPSGNNSVLNNVAIINDTLIYAVGAIYLKDTNGVVEDEPYNLVIWDGYTLKYKKVLFHDYGSTRLFSGELKAISAISEDNIYVSSVASLLHWDGDTWTEKAFFAESIPFFGQVNNIYAVDESNIYCVGNNGSIYHVNKDSWEILESGTNLPINDISGTKNRYSQQRDIVAVASNQINNQGQKILKISGKSVNILPSSGLPWELSSGWCASNSTYYSVGNGIYRLQRDSLYWERALISINYYTRVRGLNENDVFIVGTNMRVLHFNGETWQGYSENNSVVFRGLDVSSRMVTAVGRHIASGFIAIGYRK